MPQILFDNDTDPLLTPRFWILPLYRECSTRRNRPSAASERARGCTGLVKLICKENKEQKGNRKFHFFLSDGCMAQRGRCPGGRPSVSANKRVQHAYLQC